MASRQLDEEAIFHTARKISDPNAKAEYLDQICASDRPLRERVEALLRANEQEQGDLQSAARAEVTLDYQDDGEAVGQDIGRYKLREKLGEGGFGIVWAAEQSTPVRRKVALKIIKPGMDSRDVVARFEAERQALALMDHPNIARVFDGGTTPQGRPYFVMELIRGVPITEYCDENRLTVPERLRLFIDVCKAVQHAHQKGIIHRDIKPSNVLVTLHDNLPVPKVIDFGVAKAFSQQLTDKTIYTRVHAAVGTLAYMAPEQAALTNQDIDTRADVYGLGVLLYELLTGTTPLDPKRLERAALDEAIRIIREEEPPKASTKLSSLGATVTAISAKRQTDPAALQKLVRRELDWILLKALEKDRTRRYESASALANDLQRLLNHEPVEACPPSAAYRARKLIAKNRRLLAGVVFALSVLTLGVIIAVAGWIRERHLADELRREEAETREVNRHLGLKNEELKQALVDRAFADAMSGNFARAELSIAQANDAGAHPGVVEAINGLARFFSGEIRHAQQALKEATRKYPSSIEVWSSLFLADEAAGSYELMGDAINHLRYVTPKSDSERLFRAMTMVYSNPVAAHADFDALVKGQPHSAVLRALRGITGREVGILGKDLNTLRASLADFEYASGILPDSTYIQSHYLNALVLAFLLAEFREPAAARSEEVCNWKKRASEIATYLESDKESEHVLRLERATYCAAIGDLAKYQELLRRGADNEQGRIAQMFGNREYPELRAYLGASENRLKAMVLSHMDVDAAITRQERARIARDKFEEICHTSEFSQSHQVMALDVFLFAGDLQAAIDNARRIKAKSPTFEWHFHEATLNLLANPTLEAEEAHLRFAMPSPAYRCYAHYTVGMLALAKGNRTRAIEQFQSCVAMGRIDWWSHVWAEAILKRMARDGDWPTWIDWKDR